MTEGLAGELIRRRMASLSPAEKRLARTLLASYPIAGLESVGSFAERAGVSPATVTRFIAKLGFRGYPEFQDALRREVQARLSSPLARFEASPEEAPASDLLSTAFEAFRHSLDSTRSLVSPQEFEAVAGILASQARRVLVVGGRVTAGLARYFAGQLHLLRPGVTLLDTERTTPAQDLIDLGRRDALVAFDYRRYQADTIECARIAAGRGATVVLFTDPWLSPASAAARHVLVCAVETVGPFDSLVGPTALVEALMAGVLARLGTRAEARMQKLEELRAGTVWG